MLSGLARDCAVPLRSLRLRRRKMKVKTRTSLKSPQPRRYSPLAARVLHT